jgi:hypothetical protein
MAHSLTLQSVVDSAVIRLQIPTPAVGEFLTPAMCLDFIQSGCERLSGLVTRAFGDHYWQQTATLATQAGLDLVSLPSDTMTISSVHWLTNNSAYPLARADVHEYDPRSQSWGQPNDWSPTYGVLPMYTVEANVIRLVPTPNAVYSLRVAYTTGLFVTALTDTIPANLGWKEYLVNDFAEMVRQREDKDASNFTARRMEVQDQILDQAAQRDRFATYQVRDTRNVDRRSVLTRRRFY